MFHLEPLSDVFPLNRQQLFNEIFTISSNHGNIHSVWFHNGHTYIILENGRKLYTLDSIQNATPYTDEDVFEAQFTSSSRYLDLPLISSPIVSICFTKKNPSITYLFHRNGTVQSWSYNRHVPLWCSVREFSICHDDSEIVSVVLKDDILIWIEKRKSSDSYDVCKQHLSIENVPSTRMVVLANCPVCDISDMQDGVCIWPRLPDRPIHLFLLYHVTDNTLSVCLSEHGVIDTKSNSSVCEFNSLLLENITIISQLSESTSIIGRTSQKDKILLIRQDGKVFSVTGNGVMDHIVDLSGELSDTANWFVNKFTLGAVLSSKLIRFYSLSTGDVLFSMNTSQYGDHIYPVNTPDILTLFWTIHGAYHLQMCKAEKLSDYMSPDDVSKILHHQGRPHLATQLTTEDRNSVNTEELLQENIFQSPALLIALLHRIQQSGSSQCDWRITQTLDLLYQKYKNGDRKIIENKLNEDTCELLQQYWTLQELHHDILHTNVGTVNSELNVKDQVLSLLRGGPGNNNENYDRLEILMHHFPSEVTNTILDILPNTEDETATDSIDESTINWSGILTPETTFTSWKVTSHNNMPLFEVLCRLIYIGKPDKVVQFVEFANQMREKVIGVTAFTRKKEKIQLYDRALKCLPRPENSDYENEAVKARVCLVLGSGDDDCVMTSLKLLLQYKLWDDAIALVTKHADNTQQHCQLFHLLAARLLKEPSVMNSSYELVWKIMPNKISVMDLLKFIQENIIHPEYKISNHQVRCDTDNDLLLAVIKEQLIKMLHK